MMLDASLRRSPWLPRHSNPKPGSTMPHVEWSGTPGDGGGDGMTLSPIELHRTHKKGRQQKGYSSSSPDAGNQGGHPAPAARLRR